VRVQPGSGKAGLMRSGWLVGLVGIDPGLLQNSIQIKRLIREINRQVSKLKP